MAVEHVEEGEGFVPQNPITFQFPIRDIEGTTQMKNFPPTTLSYFHGLSGEDPNRFNFEFDVLCRSYDYSSNAKKLKLFPARN
jgi:hypothetical protein